ncbi:hypothetical protein BDD14_3827 [Edaphobacter modestus]|uniref:Uncharacterized protein n=1 Tax=Edaphobacter modestus TaxID=388466 RepID=A0A4Q7YYE4_9BACT|nr:hypothetical protein BDD14_3827 [Edaphobacter modestus]
MVPVSPRSDLLPCSLVFAVGMLVFGVALTPDGGEPTLKRVSDGDFAQLLSLLKLFQLSELLLDRVPTIPDSRACSSALVQESVFAEIVLFFPSLSK